MNLDMFGEMCLLPEAFSAQLAIEGLLARVGSVVHIDAILVFEALVAYVAEVQQSALGGGLVQRAPFGVLSFPRFRIFAFRFR